MNYCDKSSKTGRAVTASKEYFVLRKRRQINQIYRQNQENPIRHTQREEVGWSLEACD